jgi:hypothetical protein
MAESPRPPTSETIIETSATLADASCSGSAVGAAMVPAVIQISLADVQALLDRVRPEMTPADYQVLEALARTVQQADELLERSDLAIHRLLRMAESLHPPTSKNYGAKNRTGRCVRFGERPWRR